MVDEDRLRRHLDALRGYVEALEQFLASPPGLVPHQEFVARYGIQVAAQTCIDLANHIISSEGWRPPADYRDAFAILSEKSVIDAGLGERLQKMVGMRNLLVHRYLEIDDDVIKAQLPADIDDLDRFARAVAALLI